MKMGPIRAAMSLRAFSSYEFSMTGKPVTRDHLQSRLASLSSSGMTAERTKEHKKKNRKSKLMSNGQLALKDKDTGVDAQSLVLANQFLTFRAFLGDSTTDPAMLIKVITHPYPRLAEHGLGLAVHLATKSSDYLAIDLVKATGGLRTTTSSGGTSEESPAVNISTKVAKYYFAQLCGVFESKDASYRKALRNLVSDTNTMVAFGAMSTLLKHTDWPTLSRVPPDQSPSFLSVMVGVILKSLESDLTPVVYSACRITHALAEKYLRFYDQSDLQEEEDDGVRAMHPLWKIEQKFMTILESKNPSPFVRLQILSALIWLTYPEDREVLKTSIEASFDLLPRSLYQLILAEMHRRVSVTRDSDFSFIILHLFLIVLRSNPETIEFDLLMSVWTTVQSLGEGPKFYVLSSIMDFMDTLSAPQSSSHLSSLRRSIVWYIGEHANFLSDEHMDSRHRSTSRKKHRRGTSSRDGRPIAHKLKPNAEDKEKKNTKDPKSSEHHHHHDHHTNSHRRRSLLKKRNHSLDDSREPSPTPQLLLPPDEDRFVDPGSPQTARSLRLNLPSGLGTLSSPRKSAPKSLYTHRDLTVATLNAAQYANFNARGLGASRTTAGSLAKKNGIIYGGTQMVELPVERTESTTSDFTYAYLNLSPRSGPVLRGLSEFELRAGQHSEAPSIGNVLMEQILTRVEYATAFGLWEVRLASIEALTKIAFRSSFRVKLHVLSFFQHLLTDQAVALSSQVLIVHKTLLTNFRLLESIVNGDPPLDKKAVSKLTETIQRLCDVDSDYDPLNIL
eukprot:TRINITY_DN2304_c0_g1_i1.p1 TRINITY_DN2304_c0_g1~~TRINITY_DN2304_c0_g1_i1.p1  ORF type:complete len:799 (-),score=89.69 TRINITY_DN2304_c0_g1_i1:28-2388(-)